ncbi:Fc.00g085480.m01.CDS01 [Cosmosporella sp. VM-42]
MPSASFFAGLASGLALLPSALAGFDAGSAQNMAVYWGQNSYGQGSGPYVQERLSYYCQNADIDIIPIAFLSAIINPTTINIANAGNNCTTFGDDAQLLDCPQVEEDIKYCQSIGKTITLSVGGFTYSQGGFKSSADAETAANLVWEMFGPVQSGSTKDRPFGDAVVDGFDFDFESAVTNMVPFGNKLRSLMDADSSKKYYLSAAPQCPYPDAADKEMLEGGVSFDFIMVQYYNNYCGVNNFVEGQTDQWNFNFGDWDNWAKTVSKNPNVKVLLGIPANVGGGAGYTNGSKLKAAIQFSKKYSSFGGVMMWDMSQLYANPGFLDEVVADLN